MGCTLRVINTAVIAVVCSRGKGNVKCWNVDGTHAPEMGVWCLADVHIVATDPIYDVVYVLYLVWDIRYGSAMTASHHAEVATLFFLSNQVRGAFVCCCCCMYVLCNTQKRSSMCMCALVRSLGSLLASASSSSSCCCLAVATRGLVCIIFSKSVVNLLIMY